LTRKKQVINKQEPKLLKLAQGDIEAQLQLGKCFYKGQGIKKNSKKAIEYFQYAAARGNADAQFYLGQCYYNDGGADADVDRAIDWYKKAARQGHKEAKEALNDFGY